MANSTYTKPETARLTLHKMILEALKHNKVSKGSSMQAIKRYITDTYPDMKDNLSSGRFRRALDKGLSAGEVMRTKNTEDDGFIKARFILNRPYFLELEQKKKKAKKLADDKKKVKAKAAKPRSASKSPGRKTTKPKDPKRAASKSPGKKSSKTSVKRSNSKSPGKNGKLLKSPRTKQKIPARTPKVKKASNGPAKLLKKAKTSTPKLTKSRKAGTGVKSENPKRASKSK